MKVLAVLGSPLKGCGSGILTRFPKDCCPWEALVVKLLVFGVADMLMAGCSGIVWSCPGSVMWRLPIRSSLVMSAGTSDSADSDSSVDSSVSSSSPSLLSCSSPPSEDSVLSSSSDSSLCPSRGSLRFSSSWSLSGGGGDSRQICSSFSVLVRLRAHF